MKKKIIVPIDFSSTAQNAYLYARALAEVYHAKLEVIHFHMGNFDMDETSNSGSTEDRKKVLEQRLTEFVNIHPSSSDTDVSTKIEISTKIMQGLTIKSIVDLSKAEDVLMIVMGSTGDSAIVDRIIGRISSEVAQKAYCPVLLVPKGSKYFGYKNILYASNYESANHTMLEQIIALNQTYEAALHFLHVKERGEKDQFEPIEDQIFDKLFEKGNPDFSFNLATIKSGSVMKGLFQYSTENDIDLMVLVNRQRSFFESVLGQSLTKKIALRAQKPVLVYHLLD